MTNLLDNNAVNVLRHSIFESVLLGTGIIKGPLNYLKKFINGLLMKVKKYIQPYIKKYQK